MANITRTDLLFEANHRGADSPDDPNLYTLGEMGCPTTTLLPDATAPTTVNRVADFQAAMTVLANGGGLLIRSGTYFFNVASDSDTILIPSNVRIDCEPGVIFRWGYWGSPLFAIVNKTNVKMLLRGAKFVWTGTFGTTSGSLDKFGYGRAIPAYEWCSHIISVGSEYVTIEGGRCAGDTTSNVQNIFIEFRGKNDGSVTEGNEIRNLVIDDICQGVVMGEQKRFVIDGIKSDRYSSVSNGLYGPGHLIYIIPGSTTSEAGTIRDIYDAGTALSAFTIGSHTLSLKLLQHSSVTDIRSRRSEGAINYQDLYNVQIEFRHDTADSNTDNDGSVYAINPTTSFNKFVRIKGTIVEDVHRDAAGINMSNITSGAHNPYCEVDLTIIKTGDGTGNNPSISWCSDYGHCTLRHTNKGSGGAKALITVVGASANSNFYVSSNGAVPNPRLTITSGTNNTFYVVGDSTVDYDSNEFTPASGNTIILQGARSYASSRNMGTTTNPTGTIQLPVPGSYLVNINLISSDKNHSRAGLYWVVFDDANTNDYTSAVLIGSQITKGASAPTVLGLTVDQTGLLTFTSTAGSNTWLMQYGYRELGPD